VCPVSSRTRCDRDSRVVIVPSVDNRVDGTLYLSLSLSRLVSLESDSWNENARARTRYFWQESIFPPRHRFAHRTLPSSSFLFSFFFSLVSFHEPCVGRRRMRISRGLSRKRRARKVERLRSLSGRLFSYAASGTYELHKARARARAVCNDTATFAQSAMRRPLRETRVRSLDSCLRVLLVIRVILSSSHSTNAFQSFAPSSNRPVAMVRPTVCVCVCVCVCGSCRYEI